MEWISTQLPQQKKKNSWAMFEEIKKVVEAPHDYVAI
jgi:hypothetical protein